MSLKIYLGLIITLCSISNAHSVVQMARINQRVFPALDVRRLSDMYFPDAFAGAPSYSVDPGNSETAQNASFLVIGEPSKRVTVILPSERIVLQNGRNRAKIFVTDFRSNIGQSSQLDQNGELRFFVGATREDIPSRIPSGDYSGSFCVTVMY